jgi:hypothetical protein
MTQERTLADCLGSVVHSTLIQAGGWRKAIKDASEAFAAGDDDHGKLIINNMAAVIGAGKGDPLDSLNELTYEIQSAGLVGETGGEG